MQNPILIYLLLGIVLHFVGPLGKKIKKQLSATKRKISVQDAVLSYAMEQTPTPQWKMIAFEVIVRLLSIVFFPLFYLILIIDHYRHKAYLKQEETEKKSTNK